VEKIHDIVSRQLMVERFGSPEEVKKLTVELLTGTIVMNWAFKRLKLFKAILIVFTLRWFSSKEER
jgi:hypothetical protein